MWQFKRHIQVDINEKNSTECDDGETTSFGNESVDDYENISARGDKEEDIHSDYKNCAERSSDVDSKT